MTVPGGPRVVAIGGGHGLAASLRAVRRYASEVTAVVSVADDGGSSGRLRATGERPAPGDLRKCLVALAQHDSPLAATMEYRFADGELDGHAFGNLLIVAMAERSGDLVGALDEIGRLVGAVGRVLPATELPVELCAAMASGATVAGQVAISDRVDIWTVRLEPDAPACPDAVRAIAAADQIVLGPGSLYTSVLASVAVPGIRDAVNDASAPVVYVCNLRPQPGETTGYGVAEHVAALERHGISPDVVLHDPATMPAAGVPTRTSGAAVARAPHVVHDPELLASALSELSSA